MDGTRSASLLRAGDLDRAVSAGHDHGMAASTAELSSLATAVEELARRVAAIGDEYAGAKRDHLAGELYQAERGLLSAQRALERVMASEGAADQP